MLCTGGGVPAEEMAKRKISKSRRRQRLQALLRRSGWAGYAVALVVGIRIGLLLALPRQQKLRAIQAARRASPSLAPLPAPPIVAARPSGRAALPPPLAAATAPPPPGLPAPAPAPR